MKKTQKKILGVFALVVVVALTFFAAILPAPDTQAAGASVVDTLVVRVVGGVPSVKAEGIESGSTTVSPRQTINVLYENVNELTVGMKYTDVDGNDYVFDLINANVNYAIDQMKINYDFATGQYDYSFVYKDDDGNLHTETGTGQMPYYGYGNYVFSVTGQGGDGSIDTSDLTFLLIPVTADTTTNEDTGLVTIDLDYEPAVETGAGNGDVSKLLINIYDKDGNLVAGSPIWVTAPTKQIDVPFADYGLGAGEYKLEVFAYNSAGKQLYKPFIKTFLYNVRSVDVPKTAGAPDTGGLLGNLNISNTDYLVTGLIFFFVVGIGGAVYITKHGKTSKRR